MTTCQYCGEEFISPRTRSGQRYCNRICYTASKKGMFYIPTERNAPNNPLAGWLPTNRTHYRYDRA